MCYNNESKDRTNKQLYFDNIDKIENLSYSKIENKYLRVLQINTILAYIFLMSTALLLSLIEEPKLKGIALIGAESILFISFIFNIFLLRSAHIFKGYAIREHDITYRSGIIFTTFVTIPFCKIQQVSIRQNPITRIFGLYSIDIVNGAQGLNRTTIPGLTEERANEIKAIITERIANENK